MSVYIIINNVARNKSVINLTKCIVGYMTHDPEKLVKVIEILYHLTIDILVT